MDFGTLPPEINSGRMYSGPGSAPLLAAAAAWRQLGQEMDSLAAAYRSVVAGLTSDGWRGPSSAMMANAAMPYVAWLHGTAEHAAHTSGRASAAATAYQSAHAAVVPPPAIAANRTQLLNLVATNFFGQNSPTIAATEAQYESMWAQDTAVMNGYAASSAAASSLTPFTNPPQIANPATVTLAQTAALTQSAGSSAPVSLAPFTLVDGFNDTVSSLSGAASVSSSSFGGASIGTTNHAISVNAERDAHQGVGPFLGLGAEPPFLAPAPAAPPPAVSAVMARASIAGSLSVPQSWAATSASVATSAAPAVPAFNAAAAPAGPAALSPGMFGESMLGTLAGRGVNNSAAKLRRPSLIPRSPAAG